MDRLGICAVIAVSVAIGLFAGLGISIATGPAYPELKAELDALVAELDTLDAKVDKLRAELKTERPAVEPQVADTPALIEVATKAETAEAKPSAVPVPVESVEPEDIGRETTVPSNATVEEPTANAPKARGPPSDDNPAADDDPTVYVTQTGKKYHRADCHHLNKSKTPMPLSKAKQSHSPCSRCKPPE